MPLRKKMRLQPRSLLSIWRIESRRYCNSRACVQSIVTVALEQQICDSLSAGRPFSGIVQ
jgi:hypothetical protein